VGLAGRRWRVTYTRRRYFEIRDVDGQLPLALENKGAARARRHLA
jgi:hypothetical protein